MQEQLDIIERDNGGGGGEETQAPQKVPAKREPMPEGIYFGLNEDDYHADPSLGSHSVIQLFRQPSEYWWRSYMNPFNEEQEDEKEKDALKIGRAFHSLVLDGEARFHERFACEPVIEDFPGCLKTVEDIKNVMREVGGMKMSGGKDELIARLKEFYGDSNRYVFWDDIIAEAKASGKTLFKPDKWAQIQLSAKMITANPHLKESFTGGFPEVSIFWREDGVPCKARIDYLKLMATIDLKTIANQAQHEFRKAIRMAIASYRYDIQWCHYQTGRERARKFVEEGKVFGPEAAMPPQKWLKAFAKTRPNNETTDAAKGYTWVWVYAQKLPSAPITKGIEFSFLDQGWEIARRSRDAALDAYREYMAKFGTNMWILDEPIELLTSDELPSWMSS